MAHNVPPPTTAIVRDLARREEQLTLPLALPIVTDREVRYARASIGAATFEFDRGPKAVLDCDRDELLVVVAHFLRERGRHW